jgi:hypothetical protein
MTDLEKFIKHRDATAEEFAKWNDAQPDSRKIMNRLPFTIDFPTIKISEGVEKKKYVDKADPTKTGINSYKKVKGIDSQGSEVGFKTQIPSVIAPRGFAESKTDNGLIRSLLLVFDLGNPDHRLFYENVDNKIVVPVCHEIMKSPGIFSMPEVKQFQTISEEDMTSEKYMMNMMLIKAKMSKIISLPKKDKNTYLEDSPLRLMFLNPLYYINPEKPNEPPNEMAISLKLYPGKPAVSITPTQFFNLCEGKILDEDGKIKGYNRLGCECSPEVSFSKINIGSKPSVKSTCTAITVTRFQPSAKNDTQEVKKTYMDEHGIVDEFNNNLDIDAILASLTPTDVQINIESGGNFNPMGVDSNLPIAIASPSDGVSLLSSFGKSSKLDNNEIDTTNTQNNISNQHSNQVQNQSTNNQQWQQPQVNPMTQQNQGIGATQQSYSNVLPPSINFNNFPNQQTQVPTLNMTHDMSDRLGTFNPSMIPSDISSGSI